jgi:GDP-mannose 6-dehydrogenase
VLAKVDAINQKRAPVYEQDLEPLIAQGVASGKLRATCDANEAIDQSEISLVCVGTPGEQGGHLDLSHVLSAVDEIGAAIWRKNGEHIVVIRSTVLPGSFRNSIIPRLEVASSRRVGQGLGIASNPEFLREATAVADFFSPAKTVVGADDDMVASTVAGLYAGIEAPVFKTSIEISEMIKYADNVWHALKVAFANEIGAYCKALEVDGRQVMSLFCQDTKLNIAPTYLAPGFAFGGSCLPKDVRAIVASARDLNLDLPVLFNILHSNANHFERGISMVRAVGKRSVSVLGLSFKPLTDDIRESPLLELVIKLQLEGYDVRIFDRNIQLRNLIGVNRHALVSQLPDIDGMFVDSVDAALAHADTIVVGNADPEFLAISSRVGKNSFVVDLVGIGDPESLGDRYRGIGW